MGNGDESYGVSALMPATCARLIHEPVPLARRALWAATDLLWEVILPALRVSALVTALWLLCQL